MNRNDKKVEQQLQMLLQTQAEQLPIPPALEPERIALALEREEQATKPRFRLELRHFAMAVAAVVLVLACVALNGYYAPAFVSDTTQEQEQEEDAAVSGGDERVRGAGNYAKIQSLFQEMTQEEDDSYYPEDTGSFWDRLWPSAWGRKSDGSMMPTRDTNSVTFPDAQEQAPAPGASPGSNAVNEGSGNMADGNKQDVAYYASAVIGKTNTQVAAIDEADILKNDGAYLYLAYNYYNNNTGGDFAMNPLVSIVRLGANGTMEQTAAIQVKPASKETTSCRVTGMFLQDDRLFVILSSGDSDYDAYYYGYYEGIPYNATQRSQTTVQVYDIADRKNPKLLDSFAQDGSYLSARLVEGKLCVISEYTPPVHYNQTPGGAKQSFSDVIYPNVYSGSAAKRIPAKDLYIAKTKPDMSYIVVSNVWLRLKGSKLEGKTAAVLGCGKNIYCSGDYLYLAKDVYEQSADQTEIYRFNIQAAPVFERSAVVNGGTLNQFSMDEFEGKLRVATTTTVYNQMGMRRQTSGVYILDEKLQLIGKVEGLAKGEEIRSVRFVGKTGYVVTFEQTDPLFVLDLSDPKKPKVEGELKLPGFSSYLHPITPTLLLGLGYPGNESGTTEGIKFSLFDVSDPKKPREVDQLVLHGSYSSDALSEHKALFYYPEKQLFAIPVSGNNGRGDVYFVQCVKVDPDKKQLSFARSYACDFYRADNYTYIGDRVTYVGDTLYGLFGQALTSFSLDSGKTLNELVVK